MGVELPPLPAIGPICYASAMDILLYKDAPEVGRHLPGVRDVALWSTDQMRAFATLHASNLQGEVERLRAALDDAWKRMDRARGLLTNGRPTPECNWGMLDTSLDRAALARHTTTQG